MTRPATLTEGASIALRRLRELRDDEGLDFADLLLTFAERRVLPLHRRPHLICDMSGRRDPSRTCTKPLPYGEVARLVNHISSCRVSDSGWAFGKPPYSRGNQPPAVRFHPSIFFLLRLAAVAVWC